MKEVTSSKKFAGVWPALITPTTEAGELNISELEKLAELLISQEMSGLYILGSTGQGVLLTEEQRMQVTEAVVGVNKGRLPIMSQVGSMTTGQSVRLAQHAAKVGVDAISSVGPIYYGSGTTAMALTHYRAIATASDLPFFPYQLGEGNYSEGVKAFVQKLLKIPNVKGMKLTTNNLVQISDFHFNGGKNLTLFSGADELMCQAAMCGTAGAIGTMYNLWGPECQRVRKAFLEGDVATATHFMLTFQEVILQILPNIWSFLRQGIMSRYSIDVGMPLAPLANTNVKWDQNEVDDLVVRVINASRPA